MIDDIQAIYEELADSLDQVESVASTRPKGMQWRDYLESRHLQDALAASIAMQAAIKARDQLRRVLGR